MSDNHAAEADPRALAASTARLLQAAADSLGPLGLGCAAAALLLLLTPGPAQPLLCCAVLVLLPLERVLSFRLRLDAGLFSDLATHAGGMPLALSALDQALQTLRLRRSAALSRPLPDRVHGAQRLLRWQLLCVALQCAGVALALVWRCA